MYLYFSLFVQTQDLSYISDYSSYINQLLSYQYGPISSHQSIYLSVYLSFYPSFINLSSISLTISYPSIHSILFLFFIFLAIIYLSIICPFIYLFKPSSHLLSLYYSSIYLSINNISFYLSFLNLNICQAIFHLYFICPAIYIYLHFSYYRLCIYLSIIYPSIYSSII